MGALVRRQHRPLPMVEAHGCSERVGSPKRPEPRPQEAVDPGAVRYSRHYGIPALVGPGCRSGRGCVSVLRNRLLDRRRTMCGDSGGIGLSPNVARAKSSFSDVFEVRGEVESEREGMQVVRERELDGPGLN
jgi:hypothetical protein